MDHPKRPRRARRGRSPHPNVVLIAPSGEHATWRARVDDPDTGKRVKVRLDPVALSTERSRRDWAIRKSREIAKRRDALDDGAARLNFTELEDAIAKYLETGKHRLRDRSLALYTSAIGRFGAWAAGAGVRTTADLNGGKLAGFRDHLLAQRRQVTAPGLKRGKRKQTAAKLSPHTVNWQLRATKAMLNDWRVHGLVARLDRDAIADALKPLAAPREQPDYLNPQDCARLLEASMRHDRTVYALTRREKAERTSGGKTPRYAPIAPFAAFLLLSGCRRGEALTLRWDDVDVDALDHDGRTVGEIRLKGESTKTGHARVVGLEVSPALRSLLKAMKRTAGDAVHVFHTRDKEGAEQPYTPDLVESARERVIDDHGGPKYTWKVLRSTASTYLCNAPGIYGAATAFLAAKQLGHSIDVAEKHYAGVFRGIARDAKSIEAAMQVEAPLKRVISTIGGQREQTKIATIGQVAR